jgi:hypothetical protein
MKERDTAEFRITMRAQPSDLPAIVRLRQLLKVALRSYRFRCVSVEQIIAMTEIERSDKENTERV